MRGGGRLKRVRNNWKIATSNSEDTLGQGKHKDYGTIEVALLKRAYSLAKKQVDFDERVKELGLKRKVLIKDGVWQVPVEERAKGWERLGVKENG